MSVRVTVRKVDTRALKRRFRGMRRRARSFEPVFRWALRELERAHARNFASNGALSGNPWQPLDSEYAAWKVANYGANGILVQEGTLKSSLTDWNSRGAIRDIGRKGATFGSSLKVAGYHQYGTSNMPSREITFIPRTFAFLTAQAVGEHIVYGEGVGSTYGHLKAGLFPT